MRIADAMTFLDRLALRAGKKDPAQNEALVMEWNPAGALLLHLELGAPPKVLRFTRLRFDSATTEAEKRGAFAQFLSTIPEKHRPKAVLCWSDGMTFRQLSLPDMPAEDLEKALDWDLKKKYYFNPDENLLGYKETLTVEAEEAPERLYSVFYCENKTALPRMDLVFHLGLEVRALVPAPVALAYFVAALEPSAGKDTLICDLGAQTARIVVARGEKVMLVRSVATGGEEGLTDEALSRVAEELRKTADFYETQKYSRPLGRLVFTGEACDAVRTLDFMTPKFQIPVSVPSVERYASGSLDETDKLEMTARPGAFAAALGASLSPDDSLNLVPSEIKTKNRLGRVNRLLNLGLAGFGLLLALILGLNALQLNWTRAHISTLEAEFDKLNENKQVLEDLLARSRVRRTTLTGDVPMHALLKDLSLRTPGVMVLQQVRFDRQNDELLLTGQITDAKRESIKTVTQFVTSLGESAFFSSVVVDNSNQDEANQILNFQIIAKVKGLSV